MTTSSTEALFGVSAKRALVTGGTRGIGLMIARGLVAAGACVIVSSRNTEACARVASELSLVGNCIAMPADISTETACVELAARVSAHVEGLDILINNAGTAWSEPFDTFPAAAWDKVLDLNLKAPFHLTRALLPLLQAAAAPGDPARVVNIGSIEGLSTSGMPVFSYAASKAGLHHLTRLMARVLGPRGVTVNAIAPGPFRTEMAGPGIEAAGHRFREASALGRIGVPDDIVGAVQYLVSPAGSFVTGSVLVVDGGLSAAW